MEYINNKHVCMRDSESETQGVGCHKRARLTHTCTFFSLEVSLVITMKLSSSPTSEYEELEMTTGPKSRRGMEDSIYIGSGC